VVDPAAAYDGDDLRRELTRLLRDDAPTTLVFPDPLDRHPDHHAVGAFMLLALRDWRGPAATDADLPRMLAFLVHWPDWPPGWNRVGTPAAADDEMLALPATLPARGLQRVTFALTAAEMAEKRSALAQYRTQLEIAGPVLLAFVRRTEPFTAFTHRQVRDAESFIMAGRHAVP